LAERFNINSRGFSLNEKGDPIFEKCYHASGHASGEDITWAIKQIDPDYIVPIHPRLGTGLPRALRTWFWSMKDGLMF
jgi:mRNA degradation ribonuclease J1/J2